VEVPHRESLDAELLHERGHDELVVLARQPELAQVRQRQELVGQHAVWRHVAQLQLLEMLELRDATV